MSTPGDQTSPWAMRSVVGLGYRNDALDLVTIVMYRFGNVHFRLRTQDPKPLEFWMVHRTLTLTSKDKHS